MQGLNLTNVTFPANLTLTCTATARPRPNITWYKDGAELMESDQVSITSKEDGERVLESTLMVFSPFLDGMGNYTCLAENVVDTASSTAEVMIFCESVLNTIVLYMYVKKGFVQYLPLCCTQFSPLAAVHYICIIAQQTVFCDNCSSSPLHLFHPHTLCNLPLSLILPSFPPSSPTLHPRSPSEPDCEPIQPGHIQLHCTGQPSANHLLDRTLSQRHYRGHSWGQFHCVVCADH